MTKPAAPRRARPEIHPLTAGRWTDLETLFGPNGACAGCWCMFMRLTTREGQQKGEPNRRALRKIVRAGAPVGLLAYVHGTPAGWCAVAPRADYPRLLRSRVLAPVDDRPVWSVTCFFVARAFRRAGLARPLLEAAVRYAADQGATMVEGYPVDPRGGRYADTFAWHGVASTFRAAGFEEVARRSETRPIMRRTVRRAGRRRG